MMTLYHNFKNKICNKTEKQNHDGNFLLGNNPQFVR